MQFTAHELSLLLNGTVEGDPGVTVNQLAKIEEAAKGSLSFLANPKYELYLYNFDIKNHLIVYLLYFCLIHLNHIQYI